MKNNQSTRTKLAVFTNFTALLFALTIGGSALAEETPKQILQKAFDARELAGSEAVMTLTIYNKKGQKRERPRQRYGRRIMSFRSM